MGGGRTMDTVGRVVPSPGSRRGKRTVEFSLTTAPPFVTACSVKMAQFVSVSRRSEISIGQTTPVVGGGDGAEKARTVTAAATDVDVLPPAFARVVPRR